MVGTHAFDIDDFRKYLEEELKVEINKKMVKYLENDVYDDMLNGTGPFGPVEEEKLIIGVK